MSTFDFAGVKMNDKSAEQVGAWCESLGVHAVDGAKLWFTSDTHFGHTNILQLGEGRNFSSIEEHDDYIVNSLNRFVQEEDILFHLGDVALGDVDKNVHTMSKVKGRKILFPGNHDRISSLYSKNHREKHRDIYESVFDKILDDTKTYTIPPVLTHGLTLMFSHYPSTERLLEVSDKKDKFKKLRPHPDFYDGLIHGHTHAHNVYSYAQEKMQIQVGVDAHQYQPVLLSHLIGVVKMNEIIRFTDNKK